MEATATQSKANTWMRKREQEFIARGWTLSYGAGSGVIISPKLCEKLKKVSETEIVFGCTCTKRKIKKALEATGNLTLPVEVKCRFCGKTYTIEEM